METSNINNDQEVTLKNRQQIVLSILQEGVIKLANWVEIDLQRDNLISSNDYPAINQAKSVLSYPETGEFKALSLLFDSIKLESYAPQTKKHYLSPIILDNQQPQIPFPSENIPDLEEIKQQIKQQLSQLQQSDFQNLSLLTLCLEKIGSYISYGEENIAFYDSVKSLAMIAVALSKNPSTENLGLIAGDLSGIQDFIYTISADGALKSLRARSFFLELVTEEITQQLLTELELPRINVIYAGGGNLYILTDDNFEENQRIINIIKNRFNDWFTNSYQGKMFLALDCLNLPVSSLSNEELSQYWQKMPQKLGKQKQQKFSNQLSQFLQPKPSHEPCKVCHRDDQPKLKNLNQHEPNSSSACWVCRTMFELGSRLFNAKAIVRVKRGKNRQIDRHEQVDKIVMPIYEYFLYDIINKALSNAQSETVFLINNWDLSNYKNNKIQPILLGNYGKKTELENESGFMSASEMTEIARESGTIPRVAYLRMDVDNLGKIFAKGLGEKQNLPRLASLSRQMTYFFKVYLNTLASEKKEKKYNLLFIYAGGDDLFISGVWSEVVEFAFEIYKSFREYTGNNPSVTLSGGISLANAKYPLYQSASESGEAEEKAKRNGRDSLGLFGEVFKWQEWLGKTNINVNDLDLFDSEMKEYLGDGVTLSLFGVKPFVDCLQKIQNSYSRNFVQNLLVTAKIQEQKIKETNKKFRDIKKKMLENSSVILPSAVSEAILSSGISEAISPSSISESTPPSPPSKGEDFDNNNQEQKIGFYEQQIKDIKYFLHLPKVAYTLARLPSQVRDNPEFITISTSLKSPYNARYYKAIAVWIELLNRS